MFLNLSSLPVKSLRLTAGQKRRRRKRKESGWRQHAHFSLYNNNNNNENHANKPHQYKYLSHMYIRVFLWEIIILNKTVITQTNGHLNRPILMIIVTSDRQQSRYTSPFG